MKRISFLLFVFSVLSVSVYGLPLDISLARPLYSPGETIQVEITENTLLDHALKSTDFKFKKNDTVIPVGIFSQKVDTIYFVYFTLPIHLEEGTYTFAVENIKYVENNILKETSQSKDVEMKESNFSVSINPAFISVEDPGTFPIFSLKIKNNKEKLQDIILFPKQDFIIVEASFLKLLPNEEKLLQIVVDGSRVNSTEGILNVEYDEKMYNILFKINIEEKINETNESTIKNISKIPRDALQFVSEDTSVNLVLENESRQGPVRIKNFYNETIFNINFEVLGNVKNIVRMKYDSFDALNPLEIKEQYLYINEYLNISEGIFLGTLEVKSAYTSASLPLSVIIKAKIHNQTKNQTLSLFNETKGITQEKNQTEKKELPKKKSNAWKWILFIFFILILLFIIFYVKSKRTMKKKFTDLISDSEKL